MLIDIGRGREQLDALEVVAGFKVVDPLAHLLQILLTVQRLLKGNTRT